MTAPSYRASGGGFKYTSATVTLDKPSGTASGDVIFAALLSGDYYRTLTTLPTDWSIVANIGDATAPAARMWVCKKVAGGSEPATYDFVFDFGFNGPAAIWSVQGGDNVSISDGAASAILSEPYAVASPGVTVPDADSLLMWVGGLKATTTGVDPTPTAPAGFTNRVDIGVSYENCSIAVADKAVASGASGALTGSIARSGAGDGRGFGVSIAVSPTGGATTSPVSGSGEFPVVSAVVLASSSETLDTGNYSDVTLTIRDQSAAGLAGLTSTVSSSDTGVATVSQLAATDSSGQATVRIVAAGVGTATVTATMDAITSNTVAVEVKNRANVAIAIYPATATIAPSGSQQFTASLDGEPSAGFVWSVESGAGSINSAGLYTATSSEGTAIIKAAYDEDSAIWAQATVTVDASAAGSGTTTLTTTWVFSGAAFASQSLSYVVKDRDDAVIASGSSSTDASGVLTVSVPDTYSGQKLLIHVENVSSSMTTSGKVHGTQVATAA